MAFRWERLTNKSQEAAQRAQELARKAGNPRLEPIHLLASLLEPDQAVPKAILDRMGVDSAAIAPRDPTGDGRLAQSLGNIRRLVDEFRVVPGFRRRETEADRLKDQYISVEHLLLGLAKVKSRVQEMLTAVGVTEKNILDALKTVRGGQTVTDQNPEDKYQALEKYGRDLVELRVKARWTR